MDEQILKKTLASNLVHYRKLFGFTQAELAHALSYSDKSVSKWERGEGLPDVVVLSQIATLYGIKLDDLLSSRQRRKLPNHKLRRTMITSLSIGVVYLISFITYIVLGIVLPDLKNLYMAFIIAIPISSIVGVILSSVWKDNLLQCIFSSLIICTIPLCVYLPFYYVQNMWFVFLIIVPLQPLCIMWFMFRNSLKNAIKCVAPSKKSNGVDIEE